jgi:hypothetical protein
MVLSYLSVADLQDGDTALILAVKFEHTSIVQALLDAGANQSDLSSVRSYLQGHRALNSTHYSRLICVPVDRADSHPRCEIARHAGVSHQLRYVHAPTYTCLLIHVFLTFRILLATDRNTPSIQQHPIYVAPRPAGKAPYLYYAHTLSRSFVLCWSYCACCDTLS